MVREEATSLFLGYVSIACWLGAQFPQIIVNWRQKSVDGLALPFLANWLLGDTTNLIGCLLTDQLPFQTYLATYFVFVDICLVSQYVHYDAPRHAKSLSILASSSARQSRSSLVLPSSIAHSPETHTFPSTRISRSRSGSYSIDPHLRAAVTNMALATSELDARYQDSLASELDIHGTQGRRRGRGSQRASSLEGLPESVVANPHDHEWGGRRLVSIERDARDEAVDAESESTPSVMIDSFHSEGGGRGRGRGKHVSWTRDSTSRDRSTRRLSQDPLSGDPESSSTAASTVRGRQLTRTAAYDSPIATEAPPAQVDPIPRERRASAASAVSAAASRRSASIVFLGVFALFGLSWHARFPRSVSTEGDVLSMPSSSAVFKPEDGAASSPLHLAYSTQGSFAPAPESVLHLNNFEAHVSADGDTQRLIGRVSAWTCTTLYITSRLPQIWKNVRSGVISSASALNVTVQFARKSVAGLSMYLFIFAFLGNFFYVLSILTSPKMDLPAPRAKQFIRDSVPYLLGSGGTLLFDVTIVLQSFVYAPSRRGLRTRARRKSLVGASGEEERGLLAASRRDEGAP